MCAQDRNRKKQLICTIWFILWSKFIDWSTILLPISKTWSDLHCYNPFETWNWHFWNHSADQTTTILQTHQNFASVAVRTLYQTASLNLELDFESTSLSSISNTSIEPDESKNWKNHIHPSFENFKHMLHLNTIYVESSTLKVETSSFFLI